MAKNWSGNSIDNKSDIHLIQQRTSCCNKSAHKKSEQAQHGLLDASMEYPTHGDRSLNLRDLDRVVLEMVPNLSIPMSQDYISSVLL
jgi:hypothetical protein